MAARMSPGASLLRTSRFFSVPKPLPGIDRSTELLATPSSATTPAPTHLSITTLETSRRRGDWGMKRPLPLRRTTKSTTPLVRIRHVDSIEAVTDYQSSSDHALSLEKFQEMNIPLSIPMKHIRRLKEGKISVFEEEYDGTTGQGTASAADKRWKFNGPWLAGLSEGEFNQYIVKKVRPRRPEFWEFLRAKLAQENNQESSRASLENGDAVSAPVAPKDITDEALVEFLRTLRFDRERLFVLVSQFLDLAPVAAPQGGSIAAYTDTLSGGVRLVNPWAAGGPPATHPSAGISYLRTAAYVDNHPVYGPQKQKTPVNSRILAPRRGFTSPKLGVGGFVADVPEGPNPFSARSFNHVKNAIAGLQNFDPELEGGAKVYVTPTHAVLNNGKIVVKVSETNEEIRLVQEELNGKANIYDEPSGQAEGDVSLTHGQFEPAAKPRAGRNVLGSSATYGLGRRDGNSLFN